jgi:predicted acyltransferase
MTKERLISLDVFRGFTILLMTIVNNPGSWATVYPALDHAKWNGCTFADLVFPFFVFIVGAAIPLAMPVKELDKTTFTKIFVRSLRIICLGLVLNYFSSHQIFGLQGVALIVSKAILSIILGFALLGNFNLNTKKYLVLLIFSTALILAFSGIEQYHEVRLPGVLQRIGIVYFFTSILYLKFKLKTQIIIGCSLLLIYWVLMTLIPIPAIGESNLNVGTNFASYVDSILLKNHMYIETKTWDPEGVLSTIPTIATCILGLIIGQIFNNNYSKIEIIKRMAIIGSFCIVFGVIWDFTFPINKSIWTSSYVLFTGGLAIYILTLLYYIIEVLSFKKWTKLFLYWGVNPMIVFFGSGLIPRIIGKINIQNPFALSEEISIQNFIYKYAIANHFDNQYNASLSGSVIYIIIWSFILGLFYKNNRIFKV